MDPYPVSRMERALLGRLRGFLAANRPANQDWVKLEAHLRDGGRSLHFVALRLEMLTPEGADTE